MGSYAIEKWTRFLVASIISLLIKKAHFYAKYTLAIIHLIILKYSQYYVNIDKEKWNKWKQVSKITSYWLLVSSQRHIEYESHWAYSP